MISNNKHPRGRTTVNSYRTQPEKLKYSVIWSRGAELYFSGHIIIVSHIRLKSMEMCFGLCRLNYTRVLILSAPSALRYLNNPATFKVVSVYCSTIKVWRIDSARFEINRLFRGADGGRIRSLGWNIAQNPVD